MGPEEGNVGFSEGLIVTRVRTLGVWILLLPVLKSRGRSLSTVFGVRTLFSLGVSSCRKSYESEL